MSKQTQMIKRTLLFLCTVVGAAALLAPMPQAHAAAVSQTVIDVGAADFERLELQQTVIATEYRINAAGGWHSYQGNLTVTGTRIAAGPAQPMIEVYNGTHRLVLNGVTMKTNADVSPVALHGGAEASVILQNTNSLLFGAGAVTFASALVHVPKDATLTIEKESTGSLVATDGQRGAGIGGSADSVEGTGTIVIRGGTVKAKANDGAGIGGGSKTASGTVRVEGGTVEAESSDGAGIGGGEERPGGTIVISGGKVNAKSDEGGGIGGGDDGAGGEIYLNGGEITAESDHGGGIGGGDNGMNAPGSGYAATGEIEIRGGKIKAKSETGAGIGGGDGGNGAEVVVSGGHIWAESKEGNGIGGGKGGTGGKLVIGGGVTEAIAHLPNPAPLPPKLERALGMEPILATTSDRWKIWVNQKDSDDDAKEWDNETALGTEKSPYYYVKIDTEDHDEPDTGDEMPVGALLVGLALSGFGLAGLWISSKQRHGMRQKI